MDIEKRELALPDHAELMLGRKTGLLTSFSHLSLSFSGTVTVTVHRDEVLLVCTSCR